LNDLETLPQEVGQLTKLTRLSLFGNKLITLPPTLEQLNQLQILLVHDNELGQSGYEVISRTVSSAFNIKDVKCLNQKRNPGFGGEVTDMVLKETAAIKAKTEFGDMIKWLRGHSITEAFRDNANPANASPRGVAGETVIRSGWFTKKGGNRRNWKKRFFVLTTKAIKYFPSEDAKTPKGSIGLSEVIKVDVKADDKRDYLLTITTKTRTYLIHSENKTELESWKSALEPIAVLK
jgi:Leucine-rich repeat (LRR) protein